MNRRSIISVAACLMLVLSLVPGALAQTNTLGIGPNDVRDEPNHGDDLTAPGNGIPHTGFSPGNNGDDTDVLILETYYSSRGLGEFNNIVNRAVHGDDYNSYESYMVPGEGGFNAYWGWWTADTGSGGGLQEDQVKADEGALPEVNVPGSPNGAIDDSWDSDAPAWDEFVWRGDNPWAEENGFQSYPEDDMIVFIQPGTHSGNVNEPTAVLSSSADGPSQADYTMEDNTAGSAQGWRETAGFGMVLYDASLLMATQTKIAVNPLEVSGGYDISQATAVDTDRYTSIHPAAESLYRTAVYDPGDQESSPTDALHEEGLKECVKDCEAGTTVGPVFDAYLAAMDPLKDEMGLAMNQAGWSVQTHEPNTAEDDYNGHATFDPATCYGGCADGPDPGSSEDFYEPGADQDYSGYQTGEHLWMDAQQDFAVPFYGAVIWGINGYPVHPSADLDESQDDENTQAPGLLNLRGHVGTWFDRNGDNWIGTVADGDYNPQDTQFHFTSLLVPQFDNWTLHQGKQSDAEPYAGGTVTDPNDYDNRPGFSESPEWYGNCENVEIHATLTPMTPGERWGDTGVYLVQNRNHSEEGFPGNPFIDSVADVVGETHIHPPGGPTTNVDVYDEDGQLSKYRTHGPIELPVGCATDMGNEGIFRAQGQILFPTGTLDYPVKVETVATSTSDNAIVGKHGTTDGLDIIETVVDVDIIDPIAG